ncbi:MAG: glycoside hydrolase domain-containing protein [Armatimonadota bacterium]
MRQMIALLGSAMVAMSLASAQQVPFEVSSWREEGRGNHRAIVEVTHPADAVRVRIPWRRRDPFPERKAILVYDSSTGQQVRNCVPLTITQEFGEIVFQPLTVPGRYEIYYLPYDPPYWIGDTWSDPPKGKYFPPQATADAEWLHRHRLTSDQLPQGAWRSLPEAKVIAIQARTEWDSMHPMEVIATREEVQALLAKYPDRNYLTFPEDRRYPIRMFEHLPYRWIERGASQQFEGEAQPGEFYPFQIGIYAARQPVRHLQVRVSDLVDEGGKRIPATAVKVLNIRGTDWLGRPLQRDFSVTTGRVRALWFGVQVPKNARGVYRGTIRLKPQGLEETTITVRLKVSGEVLEDSGEGDDWRLARLRWLDSTIGLEETVVPPFTSVRVSGTQVEILGRTLRLGKLGFPESITSNGIELLAAPLRFVVESREGTIHWSTVRLRRAKHNEAMAEWLSIAESEWIQQRVQTRVEFDGCVLFTVILRANRDITLNDVRLEVPFRKEVATYMMGMERRGGKRPSQWQWKWHPRRNTHLVWIGDVEAGMQVKLEASREVWGIPVPPIPLGSASPQAREQWLIQNYLPASWYNGGKGGCHFYETGDAFVMQAYSGERSMKAGEQVQFLFRLLITPFKPFDPRLWDIRIPYWAGGNIEHIHHGHLPYNPFINYPMLAWRALQKAVEHYKQNPNLRRLGYLQYPAEGNIDLSQGAVHLLVRVNFDPKAGEAGNPRYNQSLFSVHFSNGESIGFYWNIDDRGMRAYLHQPARTDNPYPVLIGSHQPDWKQGEVHLVTLSWGERFAIYVDGKLAAESPHRGTLQASLAGAVIRLEGSGFLIQGIHLSRRPFREGEPVLFDQPDAHTLLLDTFHDVRDNRTFPKHINKGEAGYFGGKYEVSSYGDRKEVAFSGEPMPVGVNIYYTVRELTNRAPELWALRSLGDEVLVSDVDIFNAPEAVLRAQQQQELPGGHPWLKEHLVSGYQPAWLQYLEPGKVDGAIDAAIATQGLSRWHNFYLEGLRFLMERTGVDGLYLDGIGYDREVMKRVRRVMKRINLNSRIDFHSGDNWSPPWLAEPPLSSPANEYMEHFPYIDTLWLGELYDYNQPPDYWLVEVSGIPFGLRGDMLQPPTNPYRGMLYGMVSRDRSLSTASIWQLWDDFGIQEAEMMGYWRKDCPVRTDHPDVLATVYRKRGKALIALASWAKEEVQVRLQIDWQALGLRAERCRLFAPPMPHIQPPAEFAPDQPIPVSVGKGWMLILAEGE